MHVVIRSRAELLAWQDELLGQVGMGKGRLYLLAEQWRLGPEQRWVYERLRSIDWLLADDADLLGTGADLPADGMNSPISGGTLYPV